MRRTLLSSFLIHTLFCVASFLLEFPPFRVHCVFSLLADCWLQMQMGMHIAQATVLQPQLHPVRHSHDDPRCAIRDSAADHPSAEQFQIWSPSLLEDGQKLKPARKKTPPRQDLRAGGPSAAFLPPPSSRQRRQSQIPKPIRRSRSRSHRTHQVVIADLDPLYLRADPSLSSVAHLYHPRSGSFSHAWFREEFAPYLHHVFLGSALRCCFCPCCHVDGACAGALSGIRGPPPSDMDTDMCSLSSGTVVEDLGRFGVPSALVGSRVLGGLMKCIWETELSRGDSHDLVECLAEVMLRARVPWSARGKPRAGDRLSAPSSGLQVLALSHRFRVDLARFRALLEEQRAASESMGLVRIWEAAPSRRSKWGSDRQLLFGKVVGDALGVHPVWGALLLPAGPSSIREYRARWTHRLPFTFRKIHEAVHCAMGFLYLFHKVGPGFNYLCLDAARDTFHPNAGVSESLKYWFSCCCCRWGPEGGVCH